MDTADKKIFEKPATVVIDPDKQVLHSSRSWDLLLQLVSSNHPQSPITPDTCDYLTIIEALASDPYTLAVWINELNSLLQGDTDYIAFELPLLIDGVNRVYRLSAEPYGFPAESRFQIIHLPVEEEKRIHEKYNRLFQAMEVTSDAVIIFENDSGFIYNNRKFHELFDWNADELNSYSGQDNTGNLSHLLSNDDDRVLVKRKIDRGTNWEAELEMQNRQNRTFTAYVRTSMIRRAGAGVRGFVVLIRDITAQKQDQEALVSSEARYRALVEQIPAVTYIVSRAERTTIHYISPQIYELTGYTREDFIKSPGTWLKIIHPDDLDHRESLIRTGAPSYAEYRIITRNGTVKWLREESAPITDDYANRYQTQGLLFDISDRKRLEEVLRQKSEEAHHANQMKSKFLAAMSHDIRTPMHGVLGITQILKGTELDPMQKELLTLIETSGETLMNLLNDILDFSKIEAGQFTLKNSVFDIRLIVRSALGPLHVESADKGIQFSVEFNDDIPRQLIGDPHRFSQILNNIAGNAVNYTDEGGVRVYFQLDHTSVSTEPLKAFEGIEVSHAFSLRIDVVDTGVGIPAAQQKEIFSSFYRIESDDMQKRGTGLGTTIALQLTELMGGSMDLESPVSDPPYDHGGPGSHFTIVLPFGYTTQTEKEDGPAMSQNPESSSPEEKSSTRKILVAEDNAINRTIIDTMLKKIGYSVELVENGLQAVEAIKNNAYDIILMDLQMPEMDGYEAARVIREDLQMSIPIYAVTADAYPEDLQKAIDIGMNGYITKPYKREELTELIEGNS